MYLRYFLIGKLSYSPSSEPSRTVLFFEVMYTTDARQRCISNSPPWAAPFIPPWTRPSHGNSKTRPKVKTTNVVFARISILSKKVPTLYTGMQHRIRITTEDKLKFCRCSYADYRTIRKVKYSWFRPAKKSPHAFRAKSMYV